jgi:ssDNA-binding protein
MAKQSSVVRVNNARHMVVTQVCRLSYPALFTARAVVDGEAKNFSAHLIFDSLDDLKKPWKGKKTKTPSVMGAIRFAKEDQFGDKDDWPRFAYQNILKGNEEKNEDGKIKDGYEDKYFIKVKSGEKFPPKIVLANGSPATEQDVYGGCFVQAQILVRPYVKPKPGVSLRLISIRKVNDGDKFGSGVDLMEYEETEDDDWGSGDESEEDEF